MPDTITIIGTGEARAVTRGGRGQLERVASEISVDKLRESFGQFMAGLEQAFAVDGLQTEVGAFELSEIQFSAELSAEGEFKLLGTGIGVAAGSALTFVLSRKA